MRGVSAVPYMPASRGRRDRITVEVLGEAIEVDSPLDGRAPATQCGAGDCCGGGAGDAHGFPSRRRRLKRGFGRRAGRDDWSG